MMSKKSSCFCKNVFKSKNVVEQRRGFNQRWITLINQKECTKEATKRYG